MRRCGDVEVAEVEACGAGRAGVDGGWALFIKGRGCLATSVEWIV
jgi:hypothetical protein